MPNELALRRLWEIFSNKNLIRLTVAITDGHKSAARISFCFGDRFTCWKKGWNGSYGNYHPNELLMEESLIWAKSQGFRVFDFSSFDRNSAERILAGKHLDNKKMSSRDDYHLRFGGYPILLPRALLYIANPCLRWLFKQTYCRLKQLKYGKI